MNGSQDLVVLGAGPAGLAAAWRAARRGLKVTLLERADRVGGLAGSFDVAGLRVDHGSHRLHPSTPPRLIADLRSLLGADLQTRPRNGRLRIEGRWIGFPLQAGELARGLPPSMVAKVARESMTAPFRRREERHLRRDPESGSRADPLQLCVRAIRGEVVGTARQQDQWRPGAPTGIR